MTTVGGLHTALADAARQMGETTTSDSLLTVALAWCRQLVPGCEMAGATLRRPRGRNPLDRLESIAPSDAEVMACDDLQHALGEGPCLDAMTDESVIVSGDVASDPRWRRWGPRAADEHGVSSMLSVRLFSGGVHGALSLYSRSPGAFDARSADIARLLATHVSVALRSALSEENLRLAIDSRHLIGQAQGILMQRYALDAVQAFAILSRLSQDTNVRLIDVARRLVEERELPTPAYAASRSGTWLTSPVARRPNPGAPSTGDSSC